MKICDKICLYALCLQTSALTSEPHVITGTLNLNLKLSSNNEIEERIEIVKIDCSCKAGTSHSCKHVVAVLLFCNRHDLKSLPVVSSTDKKCLWKQHKEPVLKQFQALPIKTFCCVNQRRLEQLPVSKLISIRKRLINCDKESSIAKHK
ncbi:hypothetical protein ABEB36_009380 [Hypothenemus hampei]|uniref:SWIM-type domain-containing protein n=1 Tax=Hypothenemus hampei TaxID=57062 RepID=A0ABD1EG68_HYPHA